MKHYFLTVSTIIFLVFYSCQPSKRENLTNEVSIIPKPVKIEYYNKVLLIDNGLKIIYKDSSLIFSSNFLTQQIKNMTTQFLLENGKAAINIQLKLDDKIKQKEGYILTINKQISIVAKTKDGILDGIQSLLQLLHNANISSKGVEIPYMRITDYPRFKYRGMHLDVSRHFFDIKFIKKYIDLIALHKMNTFHWHLTDDQGWRIEIKKYPKLTQVGAWHVDHENLQWNERPEQKKGEKATYGGYYTQDEIRDVVSYATERGITVIPEIEMPGHSAATIAAYPEYSCRKKQTSVPSGGRSEINIMCAGKDETFIFLQNILTEVMDLFPSKYIHIGGDEAWKHEWENCLLCQKRIKNESIKDEHELQSYFIQQIDHFLTSKGRILIGWDEILEGGLAKNATVMSWRGEIGGIKAAQMKHDVIMTPVSYCYFDYYQSTDKDLEPLAFNGYIGLSDVYNYDPVPEELNAEEKQYILGAQGNIWTEYISTNNMVEYRALPRMTALSEVLWSPKEARDETDFLIRLNPFLKLLTEKSYNFHIPTPKGIYKEMIFIDSAKVEMTNPWPFTKIRYTLNGTEPTTHSSIYNGTLTIAKNTKVKACLFLQDGRHGLVKTALFNKVDPINNYKIDTTLLKTGLDYSYYEGAVNSVKKIKKMSVKSTGMMNKIDLPEKRRSEIFAVELSGYFYAPKTDVYTFALTSDDGSQFYLGKNLVIDHDGPHGPSTAYGQIALKKGYYPIYLGYFDAGGGNSLNLQLKLNTGNLGDIPVELLYHKK